MSATEQLLRIVSPLFPQPEGHCTLVGGDTDLCPLPVPHPCCCHSSYLQMCRGLFLPGCSFPVLCFCFSACQLSQQNVPVLRSFLQ